MDAASIHRCHANCASVQWTHTHTHTHTHSDTVLLTQWSGRPVSEKPLKAFTLLCFLEGFGSDELCDGCNGARRGRAPSRPP